MSAQDNPPGQATNNGDPSERVIHQPRPSLPVQLGSISDSTPMLPPPIMIPPPSPGPVDQTLFSPTLISPAHDNPTLEEIVSRPFRSHSRNYTLKHHTSSRHLSRVCKISDIPIPVPPVSTGIFKCKDGKYRRAKKPEEFDPLSLSRSTSRTSRRASAAPSHSASPLEGWTQTPPRRAVSSLEPSTPLSMLLVPILPVVVINSMPPPPHCPDYVCPDYTKLGYVPPPIFNETSKEEFDCMILLEKLLAEERAARATPTYHNPLVCSPTPLSYTNSPKIPPDSLADLQLKTIAAENVMASDCDFVSEMEQVDQGSASSLCHYGMISPISIPKNYLVTLIADMACSLNQITANMNILFKQQEYSVTQLLTLYNQINKAFLDNESSVSKKIDELQSNVDSVEIKLDEIHVDIGKSNKLITNF